MSMRRSVVMKHDDGIHTHSHVIDSSVGMAIWLGMLIDSFPESLVIGILATAEGGVSFAFIISVFISNFPEAMSSSAILRQARMPPWKIFLMWSAIVCVTGLGALVGAVCFNGVHGRGQELAAKTIEGLAAGAMLVLIAEANLPVRPFISQVSCHSRSGGL